MDSAGAIEHVDVLVVGAGIAGINAAYHLLHDRPDDSFLVIDALDSHGGTWWTHTFPGVRSDTEVFTLGYEWKPWTGAPYASGAEIHAYLGEAIEEQGIRPYLRLGHRLEAADWSSETKRWTLTITRSGQAGAETVQLTTSFLWMCHGYYRHDEGFRPEWPGMDEFAGRWIHPQHWPDDPELEDQQVVVIGSGATMATLVPTIAERCGHVTVVQRSPTYYFQSPNADELADQLRSLDTPPEWIHEIVRRKAVAEMAAITSMAKSFPEATREGLVGLVAAQLPEGYDVERHFVPHHQPYEQRICRILDGDLFAAISRGDVTMVTDTIETFTPTGLRTTAGTEVEADVVITATGFDLTVMGDADFTVDGVPVDFSQAVTYRGMLFTDVPNLAWTFGALRLSWTMRVELVSSYLCRLLAEMERTGASTVVPRLRPEDAEMTLTPYVDPGQFNPGYLQRSVDRVPRSGSTAEWQLSLDFWEEREVLPALGFDDGCLVFAS